MKRLRFVTLVFAPAALLVFSAQAGAAKPQANKVKQVAKPIWTLAMDGPRVAYASGGRIHVWNTTTDATSLVKGEYSNAKHTVNASQLAIAGNRVAWIKDQQFGNTEEGENLYTAPIGGTAKQLKHVYRFGRDDPSHTTGGWIEGLAGSGKNLVVSTWKSKGTTATDRQLSLVTPKGLQPLAGGSGAIVSAAVNGGHIATLSSSPWTTSTSASVYSAAGARLAEIPLGAAREIALSGNELIVLTPAPMPSVEVYDWTTDRLEHTWPAVGAAPEPVGIHQVGHVEAYGRLVLYSVFSQYVGGNETLHVVDPATGKDAVVGTVEGDGLIREWAIGSRGLVYALDPHPNRPSAHGSLVFVPTAKLEALLGE